MSGRSGPFVVCLFTSLSVGNVGESQFSVAAPEVEVYQIMKRSHL